MRSLASSSSSSMPTPPGLSAESAIGARRPLNIPKPPAAPPPSSLKVTEKDAPLWVHDAAREARLQMAATRPKLYYQSKSTTWWTNVGPDERKHWQWHEGEWWMRLERPIRNPY